MVIQSPLPKNAYLAAMKGQMEGHFEFGVERYTGFFLGKFFYVTHHTGYDLGQRYSNLKNAAIGYVNKNDNGCEVHFIRFRGLCCPLVFLSVWIVMGLALSFGILFRTQGDMKALSIVWALAFGATLLGALISTPIESLTYAGEEGRRCLLSLLFDPTDPYANINNVP